MRAIRARNKLEEKIDRLYHEGAVKIERWEFLSIFNQQRLTQRVWREIQQCWEERFPEGNDVEPLKCIDIKADDSARVPYAHLIINTKNMYDIIG